MATSNDHRSIFSAETSLSPGSSGQGFVDPRRHSAIIQRVQTKQGHPVPKAAYRAKGPFNQELYARHVRADPGETVHQDGATAQNQFNPTMMRCNDCGDIMPFELTEGHTCG